MFGSPPRHGPFLFPTTDHPTLQQPGGKDARVKKQAALHAALWLIVQPAAFLHSRMTPGAGWLAIYSEQRGMWDVGASSTNKNFKAGLHRGSDKEEAALSNRAARVSRRKSMRVH